MAIHSNLVLVAIAITGINSLRPISPIPVAPLPPIPVLSLNKQNLTNSTKNFFVRSSVESTDHASRRNESGYIVKALAGKGNVESPPSPIKKPTHYPAACDDTSDWMSPIGKTCDDYTSQSGFCKNGSLSSQLAFLGGLTYNYPEQHCCGCGGGTWTRCPATCGPNQSCDDVRRELGLSCEVLVQNGCDCRGCSCSGPGPALAEASDSIASLASASAAGSSKDPLPFFAPSQLFMEMMVFAITLKMHPLLFVIVFLWSGLKAKLGGEGGLKMVLATLVLVWFFPRVIEIIGWIMANFFTNFAASWTQSMPYRFKGS